MENFEEVRLYSLFRIVCDHVQSTWYTCSCGQNFARTEIETLRKRLYNWSSQRRSEPPRASRWCVYPRRSLAGHLRSPGIAARRARSSAPRHERADPRTRAKTRANALGQHARTENAPLAMAHAADLCIPKRTRGAEAPVKVMSPDFMAGNCLSALQVSLAGRVAC